MNDKELDYLMNHVWTLEETAIHWHYTNGRIMEYGDSGMCREWTDYAFEYFPNDPPQ